MVYFDEIIIFKYMDEHKKQLAEVFDALEQNQLYLKKPKRIMP